jgi:hypothetical protein
LAREGLCGFIALIGGAQGIAAAVRRRQLDSYPALPGAAFHREHNPLL